VDHPSEPSNRGERLWEETLRQAPPDAPTPASFGAGGTGGTELARRVPASARARAARVQDADAAGADYLLGDLLGAGGMGLVYAATQVALERTVAVKVLRPELHANDALVQEFLAEALVAADLDHPNTVPVYDVGLTRDGLLFYSMKLVRGVGWSRTLPGNSLGQNLDVLLEVCDAVSFAHDKGVIHRDVKPENVMIGAYGEVLLVDWGLAASAGSPRARRLTADNVLAGTPAYAAPEVAACAVEKVGKASDVYLLGGVLYEVVTGLTPHTGSGVTDCLGAAMRNELQPTEKTGELLEEALRALSTEPADRHGSVKDFADAVRDVRAHQISLDLGAEARRRFEALPGLAPDDFYRECEEIISLLQRALACWPGNDEAAQRLVWLRETLASVALRRGEIQLARSSARAADRERLQYHVEVLRPDEVAQKIKASLTDRDRRSWRQQGVGAAGAP
jgi:serine/threonine protein kinase